MLFDKNLTDQEIAILDRHAELFRSAYFDRPLFWWPEEDLGKQRYLCVADNNHRDTCLGRFTLEQLANIVDEEEFCLKIITGEISA